MDSANDTYPDLRGCPGKINAQIDGGAAAGATDVNPSPSLASRGVSGQRRPRRERRYRETRAVMNACRSVCGPIGLFHAGAARDTARDPGGAVPVHALPVRPQEDRPVEEFPDSQVDRPRGPQRERDDEDLPALRSTVRVPRPRSIASLSMSAPSASEIRRVCAPERSFGRELDELDAHGCDRVFAKAGTGERGAPPVVGRLPGAPPSRARPGRRRAIPSGPQYRRPRPAG